MAMKGGAPQNLDPVKTKEEARKRGRNGGIKSQQVQRERRKMSEIYAEFLIREHEVQLGDKKEKMSGSELVNAVSAKIIEKKDASSVSMLKEIREATEGSKTEVTPVFPDGFFKIEVVRAEKNSDT